MANYFIAGVGRALLFKGEELFADCRTLSDSSISVTVTGEDVRGGDGNMLFGRYFHDAGMSLKLTNVMFNLDFIAANTGAQSEVGVGNIFTYDSIEYKGTPLTIPAVAINNGGKARVWFRKESDKTDMKPLDPNTDGTYSFPEGTAETSEKYCIMYRKAVDGEMLTINAQFIPDTLHAVLTVGLYVGDSCNVETASKAGEVVIDIPRLQLSGAMDISSATCC